MTTHSNILGLANHDSLEWSRRDTPRHRTDYEILGPSIGRGAFGQVWKVRNKVDGHVYAMKRVANFSKSLLREVEVLSSIHHEHVVRYYAAWIEKGEEMDEKGEGEELWTTSDSSVDEHDYDSDPVCNLCQSSYRDWEVSFEQWGLLDSVLQPLNLCKNCYLKSIPSSDVSDISIREKRLLRDYLFIVMEYCDGTLQDVQESSELKWSYFEQCLRGLDYLHSTGILHRDVKPNNIFVRDGVIKIGDMGLATVAPPQQSSPTSSPRLGSKSSQVGTFLYAAPEVETGHYNEKCDVYSLGIVLVELFSNFGTAMERAETLDKLRRNGTLPDEWTRTHPRQAALALQMTAADPSKRPSCHDILRELESSVLPGTASAPLEQELREKEATIQKLRELLDAHGIGHDHI